MEAVRKNLPWDYVQDIGAIRPNLVANVVVAELKSKFANVATEESLASASRGSYDGG